MEPITRSDKLDVIEEASLTLGRGAGQNLLLRNMAVLLFMVASEETQRPGKLPDTMVDAAFNVSVEYMVMALSNQTKTITEGPKL